ncbi:hypothetical protein [Alicyclobacillus dauci]|uniref:Uncharacterized protein n=1 Tax=Alicyclobacillus dauci TaxID=1475485 RepID=A0ABY6Z366_9BACL|nr:hypothetical protein [Alicyclobacillus dauci]WAH37292.1 hypothetical protein NZD86_01720 [Alicyclobacillus dauci]
MRNSTRVLIGLLSLVLICSVVFNVVQYRNKQVLGKELLNGGLESTCTFLNDASDDIAKNKLQDAARFLSWSVGGLLVIRQPLTHYGVSQLTGITMELQDAQTVLSNPQHYSATKVQSMKDFVTVAASSFRGSIVGTEVSVPNLKAAIQQIYTKMPSSDRAQYENSGP